LGSGTYLAAVLSIPLGDRDAPFLCLKIEFAARSFYCIYIS